MTKTSTKAAGRAETSTQTRYEAQVDDVIVRLTGLVRDRKRLRRVSARGAEVARASAEVDRLQWRLARLVREWGSSRQAT